MNKNELIKKYDELYKENSPFHDPVPYTTMIHLFLNELKQLDEPEKITIPQFVADWIEYCKIKKISLAHALYRSDEAENKSVYRWIVECLENQETFARAWLNGYEVEKEKQYYIRLKGVDENYNYLNHIKHLDAWCLTEIKTDKKFRTTHTRKQLEDAGFGWVFDCPGIEIEEVE